MTEGMSMEISEEGQLQQMDASVAVVLREMGVPANIKGYPYLRRAIVMTITDMELISAVTKMLYPGVAKCYHTSSLCVEHAMRRAIDTAWKRGDTRVLQKYFGKSIVRSERKPTNSEFIATIADTLRLKGACR